MPAEIEIFRASYLDYQRKMWYFLGACYFSRLYSPGHPPQVADKGPCPGWHAVPGFHWSHCLHLNSDWSPGAIPSLVTSYKSPLSMFTPSVLDSLACKTYTYLPSNLPQNMALLPHFLIRLSSSWPHRWKLKKCCGLWPSTSQLSEGSREGQNFLI